ncbi:S8 family serine peptidase [Desulfovibrio sp. DV]|uniref:S8 family serine peptidase n=1 Tax=Desulfovibrio sp. DV TaxID=1844708 RepID=UPI00094BA7DC|nr:S8 family serine peptidase [Desulfovibrio sp. DV]
MPSSHRPSRESVPPLWRPSRLARQRLALLAAVWLALTTGLAWATSVRAAAADWANTARSVTASAKITDQEQALAAFARGDGVGRFFVGFASGKRLAASAPLADEAQKLARRDVVRESRDKALAAMPDLPESVIRYRYDNLFYLSVAVTPEQLAVILANPEVDAVEPVGVMQADMRQGLPLIGATLPRSQYDGTGLSIAVCDTGINYLNPYLGGAAFPNAKVIGGYDVGEQKADPMDGNGHGTACAGIAAGDVGNSVDYVGGVAPGAKLYALKITYDATGKYCNEDAYVAAWDWCVTHQNDNASAPIKIISTSFSGGKYDGVCDSAKTAIANAAAAAKAAGITLFNSAGNSGYCNALPSPACISSVIAVGSVYDAAVGTYLPCVSADSCVEKTASSSCDTGYYATDVTQVDKVPSYSNASPLVGLLASANMAFTLGIGSNTWNPNFGGTSAACPYAAGAGAVLQAAAKARTGSWLTPDQVFSKLSTTGTTVLDPKSNLSKPRIDLQAAVAATTPVPSTGYLQVTIATPAPTGGAGVWRVDGGTWRASQNVAGGLTAGSHSVDFKPVAGWTTPVSRTVVVAANQTTSLSTGYGLSGTNFLPLDIPAAVPANTHGINENFAGTLDNWTQQQGSWSVADGMASVTADGSQTATWYSLSSNGGIYGDFTCSATLRRSNAANSTNALIVRGTPQPLNTAGNSSWFYGYVFGYTNSGSFAVFVLRDWYLTMLQNWTASDAIIANDWNTLAIKAVGSSLTFSINGTQVLATTDTSLGAGQAGVAMYTGTGGTLDVKRVTLMPIPGGAVSAAQTAATAGTVAAPLGDEAGSGR